jgi:hypothetical protein
LKTSFIRTRKIDVTTDLFFDEKDIHPSCPGIPKACGQMGRQAQVERSTRISTIEPSFRINGRLLLRNSEIVELGSLNGLIELIRLETLPATAPTIQLEGFHFSSPDDSSSFLQPPPDLHQGWKFRFHSLRNPPKIHLLRNQPFHNHPSPIVLFLFFFAVDPTHFPLF